MIKNFVKKPVKIQAVQWTGDNYDEIVNFVGASRVGYSARHLDEPKLVIYTLEGDHYALIGDWIIRGTKGEFYPCKPDIFEQTYEEVTNGLA